MSLKDKHQSTTVSKSPDGNQSLTSKNKSLSTNEPSVNQVSSSNSVEPTNTKPTEPKKKIGRPRKQDVIKKKAGNRGAVGRPKGDAAIINEYKARMLNSPKSKKVLDSILNAALDDDHKHQAAAWKIVTDRLLPVSSFDKLAAGSGRASININISGLDSPTVTTCDDDPVDVEFEEITDD